MSTRRRQISQSLVRANRLLERYRQGGRLPRSPLTQAPKSDFLVDGGVHLPQSRYLVQRSWMAVLPLSLKSTSLSGATLFRFVTAGELGMLLDSWIRTPRIC